MSLTLQPVRVATGADERRLMAVPAHLPDRHDDISGRLARKR
ncbi:hypothetical protein ACFOYU_01360 [Microvirga sp. GCM10011540]